MGQNAMTVKWPYFCPKFSHLEEMLCKSASGYMTLFNVCESENVIVTDTITCSCTLKKSTLKLSS